MSKATHTPGRSWEVREALTTDKGEYYTITRVENRRRVHLEYASDGRPMLYSRESATDAIAKATQEAA